MLRALGRQALDEVHEPGQRAYRARRQRMLDRLYLAGRLVDVRPGLRDALDRGGHRYALVSREASQLVHRPAAYAPGRDVHHPRQRHVVIEVRDQSQVRRQVLHLLPVIELQTANHLVRDSVAKARLLQRPRLCVDPVHDGDVAQGVSALGEALYLLNDGLGLLLLVVRLRHDDWDTALVLGEQLLLDPLDVGADQPVGGVQDRLAGPVVLLQRYELGLGEVGLEAQNVADVRVAPRVYGLVGVAHDAQIPVPL